MSEDNADAKETATEVVDESLKDDIVPEKKSRKWPTIVLAVITVLGVAFGVTMMILWLQEKGKEPTIEVEEKTTIVEKVGDTITITTESEGENERRIKELLDDLAGKIPEWVEVWSSAGVKMPPRVTKVYNYETYPILYRPEELRISVALNRSYGLMLDSNNYTDSMALRNKYIDKFLTVVPEKMREYLRGRGFSQYDEYDTEYMNDEGIICQIGASWPDPAIQCAYKDWYNAKIAAFSNEVAIGANYPEGEYLGLNPDDLVIEDSKYKPYQRMTGGVLGAVGLWYRASPDTPWQWFGGFQAVPECSEYKTDDLKKAFAGEVCYEGEEEKVVEVGE